MLLVRRSVIAVSASLLVALGVGTPIPHAAAATAPPNDLLANATVVASLPFTDALDTTGATTDADDVQANSLCQASATNNSVWYSYTTTTSTLLVVDAFGSSYLRDAGMVIATGSPGSLTPVQCVTRGGRIKGTIGPGSTVSIEIFDNGGRGGDLAVSIYAAAVPANDTIGGATTIPSLPFTDLLDTTLATTDADDVQVNGTCGQATTNNSVWYVFTAGPDDTSVLFDTNGSDYGIGDNYGAAIIVATGSPGALTTLVCGPEVVAAPTSPGTTYYALISDTLYGDGGRLHLNVSPTPPPPAADATFDARGEVDRLGAAHLSGTYTCTSAALVGLLGQATQNKRTGGLLEGPTELVVPNCDGHRHGFRVTVVENEGGRFVPGKMVVQFSTVACNVLECTFSPLASQVVKLSPSHKPPRHG